MRKVRRSGGLASPGVRGNGDLRIHVWIETDPYQHKMVAALLHECGHVDHYLRDQAQTKRWSRRELPEPEIAELEIQSEHVAIEAGLRECLHLFDEGVIHPLIFSVNTVNSRSHPCRKHQGHVHEVYEMAFARVDRSLWQECETKARKRR
ncbi:hypothetical protein ACFLSJ_07835 [Verrucomicrobiota bacterium]